MKAYLKIELTKFFTNRKNLAVYILVAACALFYALEIAPSYDPIEKVDYDEIKSAYDTRVEWTNSRKGKNNEGAHPAVVYSIFQFLSWNSLDIKRMAALEKNDLKEYTYLTNRWYIFVDKHTYTTGYYTYNPRYYTYGNPDAHEQGHLAYLSTATRYGKYVLLDKKITIDVLEERTANQTIYRLLESYLPYVFYIGCLLLTADIVLQDRRNPSLLRGYPIADWKKIFAKGITAFVGSIALIIPMLIAYFIIAIQSGFGSLQLPIPVIIEENYKPAYDAITLGQYFVQVGILISGWFAVIISLVLLLSVTIRQELANLAGGVVLIFSEKFYIDEGLGYLKPVENYLPTYTQVSKVVTNVKNFFYESEGIVFLRGFTILSTTALILLIITLGITLIRRYRFIK